QDTVRFGGGVTGTVTAATATTLTVTSLKGLVAGSLSASLTIAGVSSGSATPVATVVPVVTSSAANLPFNATSLTIHGVGFSTTASSDTVTFADGAVCSVTGASSTALTVTNISGLTLGALYATVTINSASTSPVQVATVIPVVSKITTPIPVNSTT